MLQQGAGHSGQIYINLNRISITGSSRGFQPLPPTSSAPSSTPPPDSSMAARSATTATQSTTTTRSSPTKPARQHRPSFVITTLLRSGTEGIPPASSQDFTTRNAITLIRYDWNILKFNFDFRQSTNTSNLFKYNSSFGAPGDFIFLRNCQTIML